jgi:general secretion pathway protein G
MEANHMNTREISAMSEDEISRVNFSYTQKKVCLLRRNSGFTLIELIMVVILIAILAILSLGAFTNLKTNAKNGRCKAEIRTIEKSILASFTDRGRLPDTMTTAEIGSDADLKDPWGHSYVYYNIASALGTPYADFTSENLNTDFDLYSMGPDGTTAASPSLVLDPANATSFDDIVRCNDGATVELGKDRNGAI